MTVEAAVGIIAWIIASSVVLIGFGLDSVIEFSAAAVVVWWLRGTLSEERESQALRLIAVNSSSSTVNQPTELASQEAESGVGTRARVAIQHRAKGVPCGVRIEG